MHATVGLPRSRAPGALGGINRLESKTHCQRYLPHSPSLLLTDASESRASFKCGPHPSRVMDNRERGTRPTSDRRARSSSPSASTPASTASANAPASRPRSKRAKPPPRGPPSRRATSPRAEPPPAALAHRAARHRLGPRTPPSVPRRMTPDRRLESPKPPPRPSNTPFRGAGPPLDSISPPRRPPHHAPKQGHPLALPGKLSRLTGEGPKAIELGSDLGEDDLGPSIIGIQYPEKPLVRGSCRFRVLRQEHTRVHATTLVRGEPHRRLFEHLCELVVALPMGDPVPDCDGNLQVLRMRIREVGVELGVDAGRAEKAFGSRLHFLHVSPPSHSWVNARVRGPDHVLSPRTSNLHCLLNFQDQGSLDELFELSSDLEEDVLRDVPSVRTRQLCGRRTATLHRIPIDYNPVVERARALRCLLEFVHIRLGPAPLPTLLLGRSLAS